MLIVDELGSRPKLDPLEPEFILSCPGPGNTRLPFLGP